MISAKPRGEKRFICARRIWISAVSVSGGLALKRSPKALIYIIFATIRLLACYLVHRFQSARPTYRVALRILFLAIAAAPCAFHGRLLVRMEMLGVDCRSVITLWLGQFVVGRREWTPLPS